jgi:hypothetical protein
MRYFFNIKTYSIPTFHHEQMPSFIAYFYKTVRNYRIAAAAAKGQM